MDFNLVTIVGPTASGKTRLSVHLAKRIGGEIISGDSRQVYRDMNLGTGKDYDDYIVDGARIKVYLIDIVDAGYKYNIYEYQTDFVKVFEQIKERNKVPILCGGSGMYIEAILKAYRLIHVPVDNKLRMELDGKSMEELAGILASFKNLHNVTDTNTLKRLVRAIEIETFYANHQEQVTPYPDLNPLVVGIDLDRETRRERISHRLSRRLETGMIDEVRHLLAIGVSPETLIYYGLEYKFITQYLQGLIGYEEMKKKLETAIHQYAKRQMTWFRGMEKRGIPVHWLDGQWPMDKMIDHIQTLLAREN